MTIYTGPEAVVVIRLEDGSSMKLEENTALSIDELILAKGNEAAGASRFIMKAGGAMVNVIKKYSDRPSLEIKSDKGISFGVRGTTFMVFHDEDDDNLWAVVKEGSIWAVNTNADDVEVIERGKSMVVYKGSDLTLPINYNWVKQIDWTQLNANSVKMKKIRDDRRKELQKQMTTIIKRKKKNANQMNYQSAPQGGSYSAPMMDSYSEKQYSEQAPGNWEYMDWQEKEKPKYDGGAFEKPKYVGGFIENPKEGVTIDENQPQPKDVNGAKAAKQFPPSTKSRRRGR